VHGNDAYMVDYYVTTLDGDSPNLVNYISIILE
jgi:hypothetical protein